MSSNAVYKEISGYCPHHKRENRVRAEYAEIPMCGEKSESYKYISFECSDADDCEFDTNCPLCEKAINSIP